MPLPILPTSKQNAGGGFRAIRDRLFGQKPSKVDTSNPAANDSSLPTKVPSRNITTNASQPLNRVSAIPSPLSRNQDANAKAIAISQGSMVNPLIPLIQNVNHTLIRNR